MFISAQTKKSHDSILHNYRIDISRCTPLIITLFTSQHENRKRRRSFQSTSNGSSLQRTAQRFKTQSNFLQLSFQTENLFCHFALNLDGKACETKQKPDESGFLRNADIRIFFLNSMFSVIAQCLNFHFKQVCYSDELHVLFPASRRVPDFRREPLLLFFSPERSLRVFPHFFFLQVLFQLTH